MHEWTKIAMVLVFLGLYTYGLATVFDGEKYDTASVAVTGHSMVMTDRDALLDLINHARLFGDELAVAVYVYDPKTELWNRATTLCKQPQKLQVQQAVRDGDRKRSR